MKEQFDIVVIGAGPGGYVAAIRAAQLGMKAAIIERENLGGVCLNWGCIPTKALLRSAEVYSLIQHAEEFGFKVGKVEIDFPKVISRSRDVASRLSKGIAGLLKKNKVTVISGNAQLKNNKVITVTNEKGDKQEYGAKHIILATGARPRELPTIKIDGKNVWNYRHAMTPQSLPKSILVVGSGAIGVEFASFYNALGVDVTIAEIMPSILINEDFEIAAAAHKAFEKRSIKILTKTEVTDVKPTQTGVMVKLRGSDGKVVDHEFEKVISAVGVVANTEKLGLENTKVRVEKGSIKVDDYLKTDEPNVYAIGDVVSAPWLAHKASHEAIICVEKIAGLKDVHPIKRENIPACTYSSPQMASVGITEQKAKELKLNIKVGKFPLVANGKAIALGETEGMVKVIFDAKTGELLGAHMIGAEVTEMIQGYVIGKTLETTEIDLMHTIFPHPTISESMHEAVLDAFGRVIHY